MNNLTAVAKDSSVRHFLEPLQVWLESEEVTEICINRPREIYVELGSEWRVHEVNDLSYEYLESMAVAIARLHDDEISETKPILSALLPAGERIQIVFPPACEPDTISMTIRRPSQKRFTLTDYEHTGYFSRIIPVSDELTDFDRELLRLKDDKRYREFFTNAVASGQKNIVVAGGTGSGKTTFMKAMIDVVPSWERLITIEDVPELFLPNHPNHVHLFYPSEAQDGKAIVTSATLLKSCLRMKPDRILPAELRGGETFDFLNVCSSGHGGAITSCHAGSASEAFERLALMVLQNPQGRTLPYDVIKRLLRMTIDIVVHVDNDHGDKGRHITEIWFDPENKLGT